MLNIVVNDMIAEKVDRDKSLKRLGSNLLWLQHITYLSSPILYLVLEEDLFSTTRGAIHHDVGVELLTRMKEVDLDDNTEDDAERE